MTTGYNPHSIEKQARHWPVSFVTADLQQDISWRIQQLWQQNALGWSDPFAVALPISSALLNEYGYDCGRIACISSQNRSAPENLLESAFKWLARLHRLMSRAESPSAFTPQPWLQAALAGRDHIVCRQRPDSALALARHAMRQAPPNPNLSQTEKNLVLSVVYPFCPILSRFWLNSQLETMPDLSDLMASFSQWHCQRFALANGGWHWHVFERNKFIDNPKSEFFKLSWVKKAAGARQLRLHPEKEGLRLCFV